MPNKYAAPCYRCGKIVAPGEGVFEKFGRVQRKKWPTAPFNLKWQVQHHACAKEYSNTDKHHLYPTKQETENAQSND